jgi:hypothetical protein
MQFYFLFPVLEIEPGALLTLGKHSTTDPHPWSQNTYVQNAKVNPGSI